MFREPKPVDCTSKDTKPMLESRTSIYHTKKKAEKFGKSKTTATTHKPITHFNVEDDKSSPYAFDFDSSESAPQVPFRKSSSPLKPPAMIKKSKVNMSGKLFWIYSINSPICFLKIIFLSAD